MQIAALANVTVGHPTDPMRVKSDNRTPQVGTWWDLSGTWGHMANKWSEAEAAAGPGATTHDLLNDTDYNDLSTGADANVSFSGGSIILNYHSETQFSRQIINHNAGSNTLTIDRVNDPYDKDASHFLVEHKNALDIPGEWYFDKDSREVWYWPEDGTDPNGKTIRGKVQSYAMDLSGSHYITLTGLEFFGTTIKCEDSSSNAASRCDQITIDDNEFFYPTVHRRMLGEHFITPDKNGVPQSAGSTADAEGNTMFYGTNFLITNNEFAYSDGMITMDGANQKKCLRKALARSIWIPALLRWYPAH